MLNFFLVIRQLKEHSILNNALTFFFLLFLLGAFVSAITWSLGLNSLLITVGLIIAVIAVKWVGRRFLVNTKQGDTTMS